MLRSVLDVLFPRRCVACSGPAWPLCRTCLAEAAWLEPPGCIRCGRPFVAPAPVCRDCPPPGIDWCRAPFLYEGPIRRALMRMKFGGQRSVAEGLAGPMARALQRAPPGDPRARAPEVAAPVLTWVPLGRRRRRSRGFDQAEALAREVARATGLPVRRLLERAVETSPQARRAGADRRQVLAGAFRSAEVVPPDVVLVDDVLTTGATAAECAGRLLGAGAVRVGVLTAARSLGGRLPARCYRLPDGLRPGSVVARETFSR